MTFLLIVLHKFFAKFMTVISIFCLPPACNSWPIANFGDSSFQVTSSCHLCDLTFKNRASIFFRIPYYVTQYFYKLQPQFSNFFSRISFATLDKPLFLLLFKHEKSDDTDYQRAQCIHDQIFHRISQSITSNQYSSVGCDKFLHIGI